MEELREYNEIIGYYKSKANDKSITSQMEHDVIIDILRYYETLRNELAFRLMQLRKWESYLSAIEKITLMDLGADPSDCALTSEERLAVSMFDKGNTKMLRM